MYVVLYVVFIALFLSHGVRASPQTPSDLSNTLPCSRSSIDPVNVTARNEAGVPLKVFWRGIASGSGSACQEVVYLTIDPNGSADISTFVGHVWVARNGRSSQQPLVHLFIPNGTDASQRQWFITSPANPGSSNNGRQESQQTSGGTDDNKTLVIVAVVALVVSIKVTLGTLLVCYFRRRRRIQKEKKTQQLNSFSVGTVSQPVLGYYETPNPVPIPYMPAIPMQQQPMALPQNTLLPPEMPDLIAQATPSHTHPQNNLSQNSTSQNLTISNAKPPDNSPVKRMESIMVVTRTIESGSGRDYDRSTDGLETAGYSSSNYDATKTTTTGTHSTFNIDVDFPSPPPYSVSQESSDHTK